MALRAVDDHPKLARLKMLLKCGRGVAMGMLESTWHFAGRYTPQGNIGKYSDEEIEAWIEWEGDPGKLINALVMAGWLEKDPEHRLVVHDWHDHADDATRLALKRKGLDFLTRRSDDVPTVSGQRGHIVDHLVTESGLPEPVPGAGPVPAPEKKARTTPKALPSTFLVPDWIPLDAWSGFEELRKKIRAPLTDRARAAIIRNLEELRQQGHDPGRVLDQSTAHSWRGVFPIKSELSGIPIRPSPAMVGVHAQASQPIDDRSLGEQMGPVWCARVTQRHIDNLALTDLEWQYIRSLAKPESTEQRIA